MIGPTGELIPAAEIRAGDIIAAQQRAKMKAKVSAGIDAVRRGNQWAVENIPGVSMAERALGMGARGVAEGLGGLIDFFRQFPYAAERLIGWGIRDETTLGDEEIDQFIEREKVEYILWGGTPEGFEATIRPAHEQAYQEHNEYVGWIRGLPAEDYYRLIDETSRITYSGPTIQRTAARELFDKMQEARQAGREITDQEVTDILKKHEDEGAEFVGQLLLDPLMIDAFVGAPIGKTLYGLAKLPFKGLGKGFRMAGAGAAWGERVVKESRFARYMTANHPVLSEVIENTVKYAPRKFKGGVNWLKAQTGQSLARGYGLKARDVVRAIGTPPADDVPRTIDMTKKLLADTPADEALARLSTAMQTGKTGSPVHDDILKYVVQAVGGQDEFEKVIKTARRGLKVSELSAGQVAELVGHQTQLAMLKQLGIALEVSGRGRFANWLRRAWVESILFSRPGWAVVNEATNILYGSLEGYDMFGNLDDISSAARMRRAGVPPAELFETGLIAEETLKPLGLESKLALEEIPLGKYISKWPKMVAGWWEAGEQGARARIWAQASDAKYVEEVTKARELLSVFPEELQPEIASRLMDIYDNSASPQQFASGVDDLLDSLRMPPIPGERVAAVVGDELSRIVSIADEGERAKAIKAYAKQQGITVENVKWRLAPLEQRLEPLTTRLKDLNAEIVAFGRTKYPLANLAPEDQTRIEAVVRFWREKTGFEGPVRLEIRALPAKEITVAPSGTAGMKSIKAEWGVGHQGMYEGRVLDVVGSNESALLHELLHISVRDMPGAADMGNEKLIYELGNQWLNELGAYVDDAVATAEAIAPELPTPAEILRRQGALPGYEPAEEAAEVARPVVGMDLLNYPDPIAGGYPYPRTKMQVGDELTQAREAGRLTHETADNIFSGGYYGLEEEATKSLAAVYQRAPMDTRAMQEVALEKEMWLPFWDDLGPDEQAEILRKAHENAIVRSTNVLEFNSMSNSLGYATPSDEMKDGIYTIRIQVDRDGQHLYSDTRIKANELLRTYQRGLMSPATYRGATDELWLGFNTQHRKIYGDAIEEFNKLAGKIGKPPKLLKDEIDLLGKMLGQGHDTTSRIGSAFSQKFPGSTGRVIKSHPFHWVVQIEEGPGTRGMWIYVQKGKTPPGVDLADLMRALQVDATADDIVAGIPGNRWNEQIDAINTQYRLGKEELGKWQSHVHNQIDQAPIEVQDAAKQVTLAEQWYVQANARLATAAVTADKHGVNEAHRILFNYLVDSNADSLARNFIPFWKWPSRNLPVMAGLILKNPWILTMFGRYMDVSEQYVQKYNATERMMGYLPLPGTKGQIWFNPMALPMQSFNQMFRPWRSYEEQEPLAVQIMHTANRIGFSPAPWITGFRAGQAFVPGVMHLLPEGTRPRRGDVWQIVPQIQLVAPLLDMALGTDMAPTPPWHDYLVRRKIAEWAAAGQASPTTGKPIAEEEALAASKDPTSELWQAADKDAKWEAWKQGAVGYFGTYPKFFSPGEQKIRSDLQEYQEIPGFRDDLRRIYLQEHWWLNVYWNAFGPEDEQIEKYAKAWQKDDRVYPASNRPIEDADIGAALNDLESPLHLAITEQITRDIRDRDSRLSELQEDLNADLGTLAPAGTKAYEARIQQYFTDRENTYADYPLLDEEFAPKMTRPINVLMRINAKLSDGLFDESGESLVEDAPKQYVERRQHFRQQLQVISRMLEPVFGYSILDEFDVRKARYEDPTQAAYNAYERLYLNIAAQTIYDEEAPDEQKEAIEQWANDGRQDRATLATEIARVHPDWPPRMVTKALETALPDFDTWTRRNDSLKDALWGVVWQAYMGMPALDRREFRDFVRDHPEAGPQVAAVFEKVMLPKEIEIGGEIWERDRAWISIPVLTVLADKLEVLRPLEEEGFSVEAATGEAGLREFGATYEPGDPYEQVPEVEATEYDRWRQLTNWYYDLPEDQRPEDFWDTPEVSALAEKYRTETPVGQARDRFWNAYNDRLPPGRITDEIRDDSLVATILKERKDDPDRETRGVAFTAEQYDEAARRIEAYLAKNPDIAKIGTPEEWQQVRDVLKYIYAQAEAAGPPGSQEYKDARSYLWRGYGWLLDKYYPPRTSSRPPGMASPPVPTPTPTQEELYKGEAEAQGLEPTREWGRYFPGFPVTPLGEVPQGWPSLPQGWGREPPTEDWAKEYGRTEWPKEVERRRIQAQQLRAQGISPEDLIHPRSQAFLTPQALEREARAEPDYQDLLLPIEAREFKKWAFQEAGITSQAQKELKGIELRVNRSVGGGGGWSPCSQSIHLGGPSLMATVHEYAHAYWEPRRQERGDALIEAFTRLVEEKDPQYRMAMNLARDYFFGLTFQGMKLERADWGKGSGPSKEWNDWEIFAGLASGSRGDLAQLPPYIRPFYEGLFTGKIGAQEADIWPAMATQGRGGGGIRPSRGGGRQLSSWGDFERIAGHEIAGDLTNLWDREKGARFTEDTVDYLFSLYRQHPSGQDSFLAWMEHLRALRMR